VLYEAATGARPFSGEGAGAVAEAVVAGTHVPLGATGADLSEQFVDVVERALANDPARRFASAYDMHAALTRQAEPVTEAIAPDRVTATVPVTATRETAVLPTVPRRPSPAVRPGGRRRLPVGWLLAAVVVLALVVAVFVLTTRSDDPGTTQSPPTTAPASVTAAPVSSPPLPGPMARALQRLEQAAQP
jgi:serine/threonine-protein kinase